MGRLLPGNEGRPGNDRNADQKKKADHEQRPGRVVALDDEIRRQYDARDNQKNAQHALFLMLWFLLGECLKMSFRPFVTIRKFYSSSSFTRRSPCQ